MNVLLVRCAGLGMVDDISEYLNMVIFVLPFVREDRRPSQKEDSSNCFAQTKKP